MTKTPPLETHDSSYPKVLLIGNGLNRAYAGNAWQDLIQSMWENSHVAAKHPDVKKLPYPLQIVLATNDTVECAIKKCRIPTILDNPCHRTQYERLLQAGFDHILTTNYTYEFEQAAYPNQKWSDAYCTNLMRHTDAVSRSEAKYLLHTYNQVNWQGKENHIWHIHGEMRKSASIVLGHYNYGKLLWKIQEELAKRKNQQLEAQSAHKPVILDSWIDAFIMGDVYVLGFGFDAAEMDLWWLLDRKKRENAHHGNLYFYEPAYGNFVKHSLLAAYGATICSLGFHKNNTDYMEFYKAAIQDIDKRLNQPTT